MRLTLLLDQNVPQKVGNFLRRKRPEWRVLHVNEIGLRGAQDEGIFERAQRKAPSSLPLMRTSPTHECIRSAATRDAEEFEIGDQRAGSFDFALP